MNTTKTIQGDTWDIIAKKVYGNELYSDVLIKANIQHRKTVIFPAGIVLNVPEIDIVAAQDDSSVPLWKSGSDE